MPKLPNSTGGKATIVRQGQTANTHYGTDPNMGSQVRNKPRDLNPK